MSLWLVDWVTHLPVIMHPDDAPPQKVDITPPNRSSGSTRLTHPAPKSAPLSLTGTVRLALQLLDFRRRYPRPTVSTYVSAASSSITLCRFGRNRASSVRTFSFDSPMTNHSPVPGIRRQPERRSRSTSASLTSEKGAGAVGDHSCDWPHSPRVSWAP